MAETTEEQKQELEGFQISPELSQELDAAVAEMDTQQSKEAEDGGEKASGSADNSTSMTQSGDEKKNSSESTSSEQEEKSGDEQEQEKESPQDSQQIDDDTLTRAVNAGMSLSDARQFPSAEALNRAAATMEAAASSQESASSQETQEEGQESQNNQEGEKDPIDAIPDLDPEEYDPDLANAFKGLKDLARQQREELQKLRGEDGKSGQEQGQTSQEDGADITDWFDQQINSLDEEKQQVFGKGTVKEIDENSAEFQHRADLAERFQVLMSGYASAGKQVSRDEVFQEAVNDVASKLGQQLESRSSQHLQRSGKTQAETQKSPDEEAAEAINQQFFRPE